VRKGRITLNVLNALRLTSIDSISIKLEYSNYGNFILPGKRNYEIDYIPAISHVGVLV